ncbi:Bug family tripartite tricarboxylate transporter substrate binding protein [Falsiroseomonas sp. HW251]|uniref:Bug family tripartite tricarboxylate transporter substrate binding protein n=1 Tax=Falsiroseomonas sp. HW251 TaxID=3390998 RepID=UPI003D322F82
MRRRHLPLLAAASALALGRPALAQDGWPSRPIRIVVTFPPGGSSDIVARVLADVLSQRLPQRVIVDNRPGAGGTLAAAHVAQQPPDGYTWLLSNTAPIVLSPPIYPNVGYDPVTSFTHIAYLGSATTVIVVNARVVPATDMPGLIAWIKAQRVPPGYGTSGAGSVGHIFGEQFQARTGTTLTHVPYRGSAPMQADLLGGAIPLSFDTLPQNIEHIREGRLRAIAVTSDRRQRTAPEIPTTAEVGYPGLLADNWVAISAPARLPPAISQRIFTEVSAALELPIVKQRMDEHGFDMRAMTQPQFSAMVEEQVRVIGGAVRALGITAQ